jgi:hypothetical protein
MKTTISLATIGSRGVQIDVGPSALTEAGPGGVAIELSLHDGPLILTLNAQEAEALIDALARHLSPRLATRASIGGRVDPGGCADQAG